VNEHNCLLTELDNKVLQMRDLDRHVKLIYAVGSSIVCACALDAQLTISTGLLMEQVQKLSMATFIEIVKNVAEGCNATKDDTDKRHSPM
jgi:hypothetical protein